METKELPKAEDREGLAIEKNRISGGWRWKVISIGREISGREDSFDIALDKAHEVAVAHGVGA